MSITPNLCCDETQNRGAYTRLTSMVPWHCFNLAETTSTWKRPRAAGAQLSKAPAVEAEREENPAQGKACCAGNQDSKKRTQQKAHADQSQIPEDLRLRMACHKGHQLGHWVALCPRDPRASRSSAKHSLTMVQEDGSSPLQPARLLQITITGLKPRVQLDVAETLDHWTKPREGFSEDPLTNPEEIWYTDRKQLCLGWKKKSWICSSLQFWDHRG